MHLQDMDFEYIQLNDDAYMPLIGLGTYKIKGIDIIKASIDSALGAGYRSFDTAEVYKNEADLGEAFAEILPKYDLSRKDIFLISKLGPKSHGSEGVRRQLNKTLEDLQTSYIDLYLIHWPGIQGKQPNDAEHRPMRYQSWKAMCTLKSEGKIMSVGVANYTESHLDELVTQSIRENLFLPSVLQIECHPFLQQTALRLRCSKLGIHVQSYSTLGTGNLLNNDDLQRIASHNHITISQLLLTWAIQQKIGVIPKSTNHNHIIENIKIFENRLPQSDMLSLRKLNNGSKYTKVTLSYYNKSIL